MCQNIRSFNHNLDTFLCLFDNIEMPDFFIFSETWHDSNTPVMIPGYKSYHTIRPGRSGGISIFIKNNINSCHVENLSFTNDSIEICTVKISNSQNSLYICGIYWPHSNTIDSFNSCLENI